MGGSNVDEQVYALARELGARIAERGWILLNGGRNTGVMAASAEGAKQSGGTVIGILPDRSTKRASPHVDVAIVTGLGDARNLINVLSSDVVIACPGGLGTLTEIALALKNRKPVVLLRGEARPEFEAYRRRRLLWIAHDVAEAIALTEQLLIPRAQRDKSACAEHV
jgi:hypothetical protein